MTFALCIYSPAYLLHACVACMCISAARSVAVERLPLQHKVYAVHLLQHQHRVSVSELSATFVTFSATAQLHSMRHYTLGKVVSRVMRACQHVNEVKLLN